MNGTYDDIRRDGWKLFPEEPTEAMEAAFFKRGPFQPWHAAYRAMYAAAPQQPLERAASDPPPPSQHEKTPGGGTGG